MISAYNGKTGVFDSAGGNDYQSGGYQCNLHELLTNGNCCIFIYLAQSCKISCYSRRKGNGSKSYTEQAQRGNGADISQHIGAQNAG